MLHALPAEREPVDGAEVDGLSKIKALIEATVVGSRKRNHKLPSTLVRPVNLKETELEIFRDVLMKDNLDADYRMSLHKG